MVATGKRISFAEYLHYTDGSDTKYELVNGEPVPMALPTGKHATVGKRLERYLDQEITRLGLNWVTVRGEVGVRCPRGADLDTVRIPDLLVMPEQDWLKLQNKPAVIDFDCPAPLLVIEVVSPSTKTTDYRTKRTEYAARDIPEYWIVDPLDMKILVLTNSDGWFDVQEFMNDNCIKSPAFPEVEITPLQLMSD
ncbi:MAG: Uma2 family endonuclease [Gloeomargarita sp. HHBFW_bins_162]